MPLPRRDSPCGSARNALRDAAVTSGRAAISAKLWAGGSSVGARAWPGATTWQLTQTSSASLRPAATAAFVGEGGLSAGGGEREGDAGQD